MPNHAAEARALIDAVQYMTVATADEAGRPGATPLWFAHDEYVRFLLGSKQDARHSRNLAARPEAGIVIFDSTVAMGTGQAVYVEATVEQLDGEAEEQGIAVFSARSQAKGG